MSRIVRGGTELEHEVPANEGGRGIEVESSLRGKVESLLRGRGRVLYGLSRLLGIGVGGTNIRGPGAEEEMYK